MKLQDKDFASQYVNSFVLKKLCHIIVIPVFILSILFMNNII